MKYKRLFLGICLTLLVVISQAQERVLPKFKLGGALRFNYNFCDWKPGHRDRGGDFVRLLPKYHSKRGLPLLQQRFRWSHAEIRVDRLPVQRQKSNATGTNGSAFRYSTYRLAQFLPANRLLHRTRRRFRHGNQVFISR